MSTLSELTAELGSSLFRRPDQFDVADTQGLGEFVERDHGWIALPAFEAADVLLTEAGTLLDLLLRQAPLLAQACKVPTDEATHIHAAGIAVRGFLFYAL